MDQSVVRRLIRDLAGIENILVVLDSRGAVAELSTEDLQAPEFKDHSASVEGRGWNIHLDMRSVDGVQFVEAEDNQHNVPKLYYARLHDENGETLLRFYFPNPWLDDEEKPSEFQPERLKVFEEHRDRWFGTEGVAFVRQRGRQGAERGGG